METKDSFIFYRSFFEAASALPDTERLHLMDAICEFGLNHKQLELDSLSKAMFCLIKPQLEANHKKWLNGKKGGRPKALEPEVKDKKKPKRNRNKTKDKPQAIDLNIIHEDEQLIVINKPAGLTAHPGAGTPEAGGQGAGVGPGR